LTTTVGGDTDQTNHVEPGRQDVPRQERPSPDANTSAAALLDRKVAASGFCIRGHLDGVVGQASRMSDVEKPRGRTASASLRADHFSVVVVVVVVVVVCGYRWSFTCR
jgi:hypothetical protein